MLPAARPVLRVEPLAARDLPAVTFPSLNVMEITADPGDNVVVVSRTGGLFGRPSLIVVVQNTVRREHGAAGITRIVYKGGPLRDQFQYDTAFPCLADGGANNGTKQDNLTGGSGDDTLTIRDAANHSGIIVGPLGTDDSIRFESAPGVPLAGTIVARDALGGRIQFRLERRVMVTVAGPGTIVLEMEDARFLIPEGVTVSVSGLALHAGRPDLNPGFQNEGTLALYEVSIGDLRCRALVNVGTATLDRVTVAGNDRGVLNADAGVMRITSSTVFFNRGTGVVQASLAGLDIRHSTIASNRSEAVTDLPSARAGGVDVDDESAPVRLDHVLLAGNERNEYDVFTNTGRYVPADAGGAFDPGSRFNLVGAVTPSAAGLTNGANGNIVGTPATPIAGNFDRFDYHGGAVPTLSLFVISPAVDAGDSAFAPPPALDQRGQPRVQGAASTSGPTSTRGFRTPRRPSAT